MYLPCALFLGNIAWGNVAWGIWFVAWGGGLVWDRCVTLVAEDCAWPLGNVDSNIISTLYPFVNRGGLNILKTCCYKWIVHCTLCSLFLIQCIPLSTLLGTLPAISFQWILLILSVAMWDSIIIAYLQRIAVLVHVMVSILAPPPPRSLSFKESIKL